MTAGICQFYMTCSRLPGGIVYNTMLMAAPVTGDPHGIQHVKNCWWRTCILLWLSDKFSNFENIMSVKRNARNWTKYVQTSRRKRNLIFWIYPEEENTHLNIYNTVSFLLYVYRIQIVAKAAYTASQSDPTANLTGCFELFLHLCQNILHSAYL